jgi:hypothetical protein
MKDTLQNLQIMSCSKKSSSIISWPLFFQPHWTRFVTSSDHHSATRGKAGPAAFALRNIFAKGLGEDRIDAANLPEASCSLRGLGVKNSKKKDENTTAQQKNHCVSKQKCPTSEENSKRESEIGQNSVVF